MGQHGECAATGDKRRLRAPEHRWAVPGNWLEPTALGVCAARCLVTACVRGTKNNIIISKDRNFKIYYGPFTFDKANSLAPIKSKPRLSYFYIPCRLCRSAILAGLLHSRSLRSHGVPAQCLYPTRFCLTPHIRPVLSILSPSSSLPCITPSPPPHRRPPSSICLPTHTAGQSNAITIFRILPLSTICGHYHSTSLPSLFHPHGLTTEGR